MNKFSESKPQQRIVHGWQVPGGEFPSNVRIEIYYPKRIITCSGALLDEITVLTVAHCSKINGYEAIYVYAGDYNSFWSPLFRFWRYATKIIIHENYTKTQDLITNDIAMYLLDSPIPLRKYIQYANFQSNELTKPGDTIYIVGWGDPVVTWLAASNQTVMSNEDCVPNYKPNEDLTNGKQLCSLGKHVRTSTSCPGDSGGPAYFVDNNGKQWLVGIISYRDDVECGSSMKPTVMMRVSHYYNWIENIRKKIKEVE